MPLDLSRLNPRQYEAVMHDDGPMLVLACAGSGKTQVIIYRIARLIQDGVPPEQILGVTFTNKAAAEMRERLRRVLGRQAARSATAVWLSTFHSLALSILKEETQSAGLRPGFAIYDTSDQLSLLRELMRQVKVADRRLDAAKILDIVLRTKRQRRDEVELLWGDDYELAAYDLYPRYVEQMRAFNAIDFDDLLLRAQDVMRQDEARQRWARRFRFLLVDEYQDTSPDQLDLVRVLAGPERNVCAVGDDDQSIYAWRGAAIDNILSFAEHFPGTREVVLDQNYRSTGNILSVANAVIKNNSKRKHKVLWSAGGDGDPVEVVACADGDDEAAMVCETIGRLLYDGVPHEDIAVLYRSNLQSRIFEETLGLENIPFRVVGGQAFFDRKEVRDAMAFLAVASNPYDEVALRRIINVPPRGIGATSVERLCDYGERHGVGLWGALLDAEKIDDLPKRAMAGAKAFVEFMGPMRQALVEAVPGQLAPRVRRLFDELNLREIILEADDAASIKERRLENLDQAARAVERFEAHLNPSEKPLETFLRASTLVRSPSEGEDETKGQVTLMTLHSAKGLEFPYVFLVGLEDELLPHKKTLEEGGEISEERRLFYVGITRAKKRLWLTHASSRVRHGRPVERTRSRFLDEIPAGNSTKWRSRGEAADDSVDNDALAEDFFRRMRSQLGMDDEADVA